jgi:hydrogenase maturation protease
MDDRAGRTLIVGLGSPILRDDAIGLHVARALAERLPSDRFSVAEAGVSGLRLLLTLEGWERAIIIDALTAPPDLAAEPCLGRLHRLSLDQLHSTLTLNTSHEASLADTLELGRMMGMSLPRELSIFGIEVDDPFTFDEQMTPALAERVGAIAGRIADECACPAAP